MLKLRQGVHPTVVLFKRLAVTAREGSSSAVPAQAATAPASQPEVEPPRPNKPREPICLPGPGVVVIGAGLAGLSAAAHLLNGGVERVTVLEARARPGGRLQSSFLGDAVIELGAPWTTFRHVADNAVVRRALRDGFLPASFEEPGADSASVSAFGSTGVYPCNPMRMDAARTLFVDEQGMPIPDAVALRAYHMAKDIDEDVMTCDGLVGLRARLELQRVPPEHRNATARVLTGLLCARRLRSQRDQRFVEIGDRDIDGNAKDADDVLCASLGLPGAGFRVPLGHAAILEPLLKTVGPDRVLYGKEVQSVRWGAVRGQHAVVRCQDGDEHVADYVIVALPLGVLKNTHNTMFLPSLPAEKVRAIERLQAVAHNRVFLDYERPFWAWLERLRLDTASELRLGPHSEWVHGIFRLKAVTGSNHVLKVDVQGERAADMELCTDEQVIETITQYLRQSTGDMAFPYPTRMVRTRWSSDAFSCGAQTQYARGDEGRLTSEQLAEPVHGTLYFAGEATSHRYLSTARGAALSGVREADRVLERVAAATRRRDARRDSGRCVQRAQC